MKSPGASNRRQFLTGQAAARAIAQFGEQVAENLAPAAALAETLVESYLVQVGRVAMACQFQVCLNAGQYERGTEAALAALDLVDQLEEQLSVYRETSEVSALNRLAWRQAREVEPRLFELLCTAARLHQETEGAFDITSGPLSKVWGFFRRQGAIPSSADLERALTCVGSRLMQLDPARKTVQFLSEGLEINLGAIGKGYALDRCAESMQSAGIVDFLWHAGASSVLARGSPTTATQDRPGWRIAIRDPLRVNRPLAEIQLHNAALGTSGSGVQFFRHAGKRYGHILDPRTGWPARGVFSSTVVASTAAEADALSTAFYVLGKERAAQYCQDHPGTGALLVVGSDDGTAIELVSMGLADDQWRALVDE